MIYGALVSGLSTKTGEENIAIWDLAQSLKKSPALMEIALSSAPLEQILDELRASPESGEFSVLFSNFIAQYGHRGGAERDAFHPRYRHQPARVLLPVRSMLLLDEDSSPASVEHKLAARMQETRARCLRELRKGPMGFIRAPIFGWFVELVQQWMYYRDFERWYNDKTMARPHDFLHALGRRFVRRGIVKEVKDAFFLSKDELIWADEGSLSPRDAQNRIRGRRSVYQRYSEREPPKYIQGWRTFDDETLSDDGHGLRGIGASRGVATGRARVCRKLEEIGKVEKGDILVTVATDPGWTTVFSFIGGVVVESGGVVAHAVLISREYGLPCVANLAQACVLIPDGAMITVDGGTGRVVIHADDESAA